MDRILEHLQSYGLEYFEDQEAWQRAALERMGEKDLQRLQRYRAASSAEKDTAGWSAAYYDFLGHYSRAGVCHSQKMLTLAAHGDNIDRVLPPSGRVLDIGANVGWLATWYALQSNRREVVGIDVAPRCIHEATKAAVRLGATNATFEKTDYLKAKPAGVFDAVVDTQALCDLKDPGPYLARVSESLRPGGVFVSVPSRGNEESVREYFDHLEKADLAPQYLGYHATRDLGQPAVYPMVVAHAGGAVRHVDVADRFREIKVAMSFLHWDIFLRATDGGPEVALFIPGVGEEPDRVQEGDRPASVNGVPMHQLDSARLSQVYKADGHYDLCLLRGSDAVHVRYD